MLEKERELALILTIAFMQGALEFYQLPIFYFYKDHLKVSISGLSLIQGIVITPWILKPVMGFISDSFYFLGSRKKSYIIVSCLIEMMGYLILSTLPESLIITVGVQLMNYFCVVFRNVIGETILVKLARDDCLNKSVGHDKQSEAQTHVSYFFGAKNCGALIFSYLGGFSMEFLTLTQVFKICIFFPLTILLNCVFIYHEKKTVGEDPSSSLKKLLNDIGLISRVLTDPRIKGLLLMVLVLIISPNLGPTFNFYFTEHLKFSPELMGEISFVSSLAYLMGILSLNTIFKGINFRRFYISTSFISAILSSSTLILLFNYNEYLGISDKFFCLSSSAVQNFIAEINFLPMLSLCCLYCPQNLEGTTYAVFTAIFNFANYLSTLFGSILVFCLGITNDNFQPLWILVVFQTLYSLLGAFFLKYVTFPDREEIKKLDNSLNNGNISRNELIHHKDNLNLSKIIN
jgi:hypothetical protein